MKRRVILLSGILSACCILSNAQQADSTYNDLSLSELDSMLTQEDSLSIFNLIDSLLQMEMMEAKSQLALRLGYNSNAASTARTFGFAQFGLSPGISYYHKSGAYLDASGYWSQEFEPNYYLTILSAGYMGAISKNWTFLAEYGHYFYSDLGDSVSVAYKNSLGISNFIDVKPLTFRFDYTWLFGDRTGHRVMPGVMLNLEKRNWKKINRIIFYPSFNLLMGSEQFDKYLPYTNNLLDALNRVRNGLPLYYQSEVTEFGVMNYSINLPLSVTVKSWNFLLTYTYNIPKALPGEDIELDNSGFLGLSITKYFRFN